MSEVDKETEARTTRGREEGVGRVKKPDRMEAIVCRVLEPEDPWEMVSELFQ